MVIDKASVTNNSSGADTERIGLYANAIASVWLHTNQCLVDVKGTWLQAYEMVIIGL